MPIGYNNSYHINAISSPVFDPYLMQSVVTQRYPPLEFYQKIKRVLMPIAPEGLSEVLLTGSGDSNAVEQALRAGLLKYKQLNPSVSAETMTVLAFDGCSHGHSLATIGLSKHDPLSGKLPSLNVVTVPMPKTTFPLGLHEKENEASEKAALERVREVIETYREARPIATIIVEPVQNRDTICANPYFYRKLRNLAKDKGIPFVVDEVHTGLGSTGKMWACEYWMTEDPADILVFGKKAHVSGYFCKPQFRPADATQLTDCWNNVGTKLSLLEYTLKCINHFRLLERITNSGAYLQVELQKIEARKAFITNIRGTSPFSNRMCRNGRLHGL